MVMKRFAVVFGLMVLVGACNKPSEDDCRKAILNFRSILGTESPTSDIDGDVRRCKGGSSKKAVECASKAKSVEELRACGFLKVPDKGSTPGSAAAPTPGSAAAPAPTPGSGAAN
jgi:hypothetical protein